MSLAYRIIPTLLCRGSSLYKGERFDSWREVGHAMQSVRVHQARGVDELILLDIGATPERREPDYEMVKRLSEECFMPLTVGGGVSKVEHVDKLLRAGADKVAICTAAARNLVLINEISSKFGGQCLVVAIDVKGRKVATHCGGTLLDTCPLAGIVRLAQEAAYHGAGEILLTSIDRDGTLQGYDLDLIREVSQAVNIPVIASGGCGTYQHMYEAIQAGASAVAAGAMFQFTDATPKGAANYLAGQGMEARV